VNTVRETVSTTVHKVEDKAAVVAQEAKSVFDPKPSAPPPPPPAAISSNPTVSARQAALNPALLRNDLSIAAGKPPEGPAAAAEALIKKHTHFPARLDEEALGKELKKMIEENPANAAPILKEVMAGKNGLGASDVDDVSVYVAEANSDSLRKLAETPDGLKALEKMKKELGSDFVGDDDKAAYDKLDKATREAQDKDLTKFATERKEMVAASVYAANGHKQFDLNDPQQVQKLITSSPQLDNLDSTKTDASRCGGASILNGMLLAGDPAKNAAAIESAATKAGVQPGISADERSALDAMKKGSMTPTDAAHLQELLVRSAQQPQDTDAKRGIQRSDAGGVSTQGLSDFAQKLRAEGAFANAKKITFHNEGAHWTVAVTNKSGETTAANSFPDPESGRAEVGKAPLASTQAERKDFSEFSITNRDDGQSQFSVRGGKAFPGAGVMKFPEKDGGFVDPAKGSFDGPLKAWSEQAKDKALMKKLVVDQKLNMDPNEIF
jgi:hypothetical protein